TLTFTPAPTVDAGADQSVCANNADVSLSGTISSGSPTWTTSGDGSFDDNTSLTATYTPGATDITNGSVTLTLTSSLAGCNPVSDQMTITITPAPIVNAGADVSVCRNNPDYTLSGTVSSGSPTWTTSGDGSFDDANSLTATYTPGATDLSTGSVTLTLTSSLAGCNPVSDQITITYTDEPIVDAGADQTLCANNSVATINGTVDVGGTTNLWTTSGTGTFANANNLSTTYSPSAADITSGTVTLTLTATLTGCNPVSDQITLTFTPAPTVDAGADQSVCANNADVILNGTVSDATATNTWSSTGTGTFADVNNLNTTYTPSATDVANGSVTIRLTANVTGCNPVSDQMTITINPAPIVDAGRDTSLCKNDAVYQLQSTLVGSGTIAWASTGSGSFSNNTIINPIYTPSAADLSNGSVTLTVLVSATGCMDVFDEITISYFDAPVVDAGVDQAVCANNSTVILSGNVSGSTTTGIWSTNGDGTFSDNTDLNATYTPGVNDISNGTVTITLIATGSCFVQDEMIITITPAPIVDAGADQVICESEISVLLSGTVSGGATQGEWTTLGDGSFSNPNDLNATYTFGANDVSSQFVQLVLTSFDNGNCLAVSDTVNITITSIPVVDAGLDQTVCANVDAVLNGTVTGGAGTGIWTTSGTGTFANANNLNTTYTPSAADIAAGTVTLTLTSTNGCQNPSDDLILTITPAPIVDAGIDQTVCATDVVNVSGTIGGSATQGVWTTTGSGTFADDTSLSTTYTPSSADTTAGSVDLILTSTDNGSCNPVSDTLTVTFKPSPTIDAGADQTICKTANVVLNATVGGGATQVQWTTSGDGTFTDAFSTNTVYIPGVNDTIVGTVTLTVTTTDASPCADVSDDVVITFEGFALVDAGSDVSMCANNVLDVALNGSISGASTTGTWTTSGDGVFSNDTDLNATYTPGVNDITNGTITLTLTATGSCFSEDELIITITPSPIVDAGSDQIVCEDEVSVVLSGSVSGGATQGEWTTLGDGTFSNPNDLNATYTFGANDVSTQFIQLVLTSFDNGNCLAVSDTVNITITSIPVVDAGADQTVCANVDAVLSGTVTGGAGTGVWTTSGTGTFANANNLNTTYTPSAADIAAGTVTLTLTSTNGCQNPSDDLILTITPAPTVDAGVDQSVCETGDISIVGVIGGSASQGVWTTSGTGTFSDANSLSTIYTPSAADGTAGSVELILTTTDHGDCNAVSDTLVVSFIPNSTIFAGDDQTVCETATVIVDATLTGGATTVVWTTSGDGSFTSITATGAVYIPGTNDVTNGSVTLTATTTDAFPCVDVSDDLTVTFDGFALVDAGSDVSMCANNAFDVALNGSVSGISTTGIWSTNGDGTFSPDETTLNATYILGTNDLLSDTIELYLNPTNAGACNTLTDTLFIFVTPAPIVDAGPDQSICISGGLDVGLNGSVSGGSTTGEWTTNGLGTFSDVNDLNATYTPDAADVSAGIIEIYLTSTNNGDCNPVSDTLIVTFDTFPTVEALGNSVGCFPDTVMLDGVINGGGTLSWTSNGSGVFFPNNTDLATGYIPSSSDQGLNLTFTLSYTNGCGTATDDVTIFIIPQPIADFIHDNCNGLDVQFVDQSSGSSSITSWQWDFGDGNTSTNQNPNNVYASEGLYDVQLIVETAEGCSDTLVLPVAAALPPTAYFEFEQDTVLVGTVVNLTNQSSNENAWQWVINTIDTSYMEDTLYVFNTSGIYPVKLTVWNEVGCVDSILLYLVVLDEWITGGDDDPVFPPVAPTAFSPNGDDVNDIFRMRGGAFSEYELRVFNEWGNQLFISTDPDVGWNGSYKDKMQPTGVYIWTFKGTTIDGNGYNMQGEITLIR
ncbi:MAG: PKD domain-containing protein, partial [Bacteroidia bacterium]